MIHYRMYQPQQSLRQFVRFFWSIDAQVSEIGDPFIHRTLPDNCIELIFYCKGTLSISSSSGNEGNTFTSGIFGQTQKFRLFKTTSDFRLFGVYLYPHTFKPVFNIPANDLCDQKVDLETLWGIEGKMLEEQIMLADHDEQRIHLVSNFLLKRIKTMTDYDRAFIQNITSVIDQNRVVSIPSFAHECNLSRRQLERKFKAFSGFSPKDFFSIVRFKNVLKEIEQRSKPLAQIAIDTGYYDQSHFTNEFRKLSGYSPREFAVNYPEADDMRATRDFKK